MRRLLLITTLMLAGLGSVSAVSFATQRLEKIAKCITLPGLDTLQAGTHDSVYWFRKHPLTVRINQYEEVEHIGLKLFSDAMRSATVGEVCDFLERNLLERNLPSLDGGIKHDLMYEPVWFIMGNAQTPLGFDGNEGYSEERIDYRKYRASWARGEQTALRITFDMDYHMMSGCNAIELEQRFITRLKRFERHEHASMLQTLPENGQSIYVVEGDTFLIHEMNNELLFEHNEQGWHLSDSLSRPTRALRNMLISLDYRSEPQLLLTLDKYGYETETLQVPYKDWLQLCIDDGCTPYFGIKKKTETGYDGTVLMVNRNTGYLHMLSLSIDRQEMAESQEPQVRGRLYVYIPLHNVDDIFFRKPINRKKKS